jgi:anaerobic selenocysteine-containing dehydrogenase
VRPGGDIAALMGVCKHVLARAEREAGLLYQDFIAQHTDGFAAFRAKLDATGWDALEAASGVTRAEMEAAGDVYADAKAVIGIYGMGLTQQVHGSEAIGLLVNLLLLGGNIGRPGAGCSPIRGHSNVQGSAPWASPRKSRSPRWTSIAKCLGWKRRQRMATTPRSSWRRCWKAATASMWGLVATWPWPCPTTAVCIRHGAG